MRVDGVEVHTVPGRNNLKPAEGEVILALCGILMVLTSLVFGWNIPNGWIFIPASVVCWFLVLFHAKKGKSTDE